MAREEVGRPWYARNARDERTTVILGESARRGYSGEMQADVSRRYERGGGRCASQRRENAHGGGDREGNAALLFNGTYAAAGRW